MSAADPQPTSDAAERRAAVAERVGRFLAAREDGKSISITELTVGLDATGQDLLETALQAIDQDILPRLRGAERPGGVIADRYELQRRLGAGGYGRVWQARDRHVGRDVALKFIDPPPNAAAQMEAVFETERSAMARTDGVGIARILDTCRQEGSLVLVIELIRGETLATVLDTLHRTTPSGARPALQELATLEALQPLPGSEDLRQLPRYESFVVEVIGRMLRALENVHGTGLVHRDLKPTNVMLRGGAIPVLLDFGMAAVQEAVDAGGLAGTPNYLAPEQLRQLSSGTDVRTDLYQVGLICFEMLTLMPAYAPGPTEQVLQRVRTGRIPPIHDLAPWVDPSLAAICHRALDPDPNARYQTASAFRGELEQWFRLHHLPAWPAARFVELARLVDEPRLKRMRMRDEQRQVNVIVEVPGHTLADRLREDFDLVLRELRALEQIDHPGVLRLRGCFASEDGLPWTVLDGRGIDSLEDRLANGPLEREEVARIGIELAGALAAVHAEGHLHRDVAPRNVLFDREGRALLAGFCFVRPLASTGVSSLLSRDHGNAPQSVADAGLPDHSAPEQFGGPRADHRADVYALGCVLYRAATGAPADPLGDLRCDRTELRRRVGRKLADVIASAMANDRTARPQSMPALRELLEQAMSRPGWQFWRRS